MQQYGGPPAPSQRPPYPTSRYKSVKALLLQWEADDLGVDPEVTKLAKVLEASRTVGFNFSIRRYSIPTIGDDGDPPEDLLHQQILKFRRDSTPDDLLILYYGGHGGGSSQRCIWSANARKDTPWLNWHNVQGMLLGCPADVLLILDCCYATLAASNIGVGRNWMLGATTKESITTGVAWNSFTRTIIRELERCADLYWMRGQKLSVQTLHSSLIRWERDLDFSPVLTRLTDHDCSPTDLTPLLVSQPPRAVQSNSSMLPRTPLPQPCPPFLLFQPRNDPSSPLLVAQPVPFTDGALHHSHLTIAPAIENSSPHDKTTIYHSLPKPPDFSSYDPYGLKFTDFPRKFTSFDSRASYIELILGESRKVRSVHYVKRTNKKSRFSTTVLFYVSTIPRALIAIAHERNGRLGGDIEDIADEYRRLRGHPPIPSRPMTSSDDPAPQFEAIKFAETEFRV